MSKSFDPEIPKLITKLQNNIKANIRSKIWQGSVMNVRMYDISSSMEVLASDTHRYRLEFEARQQGETVWQLITYEFKSPMRYLKEKIDIEDVCRHLVLPGIISHNTKQQRK